uniref:VWFD domain-containing protein n=1 Tax=Mesocestoides corti TaxID=53468 RepID=A0A5K3FX22_MESCO
MNDMMRLDIQRVQGMMQSCLSKRPCTSRTTQFYVVGNRNPQYNATIAYPQSISSNRNVLKSFRLSADILDLNVTTCIIYENLIMTHRIHGPIRLSDVVIQADVIVDKSGRLHIENSQVGFGSRSAGGVNLDNNYYHLLVQKLAIFIDAKC